MKSGKNKKKPKKPSNRKSKRSASLALFGETKKIKAAIEEPVEVFGAGDSGPYRDGRDTFLSDIRLKTRISKIENPCELLSKINGYFFYWNSEKRGTREIGVMAQEVEKVLPEVVLKDESGISQVQYGKLTALLVETIKCQEKEIQTLGERIMALEKKFS